LLGEADTAGIPIMRNDHLESTIREVLSHIGSRIMERYPPDEVRLDG
jgi:2-phosphoglycerate kinase